MSYVGTVRNSTALRRRASSSLYVLAILLARSLLSLLTSPSIPLTSRRVRRGGSTSPAVFWHRPPTS